MENRAIIIYSILYNYWIIIMLLYSKDKINYYIKQL